MQLRASRVAVLLPLVALAGLVPASCGLFAPRSAQRGELVLRFAFPELPGELPEARYPGAAAGRARTLDPGTTSIKVTVSGPGMDAVVVQQAFTPPVATPASITVSELLAGANRRVDLEAYNAGGVYASSFQTGITIDPSPATNSASLLLLPSSPLAWSAPRLVVAGQPSRTVFIHTNPVTTTGQHTIVVDPDPAFPFTSAYLWLNDGSLSAVTYDPVSRLFPTMSITVGADPYYLGLYSSGATAGTHRLAYYRSLPGNPDTGFGPGGIRYHSFPSSAPSTTIQAAARQADGSILFVGSVSVSGDIDFFVCRFTPQGRVDPSFGAGRGWVRVDFSSANDVARAVAVQGDGKIVVAGGNGPYNCIARFNADGNLDAGFGTGGKFSFNFSAAVESASCVAISPAGKIVVGGFYPNDLNAVTVARLTSAGSLDPSFNSTGTLTLQNGISNSGCYAIAVDASERIWVGGQANNQAYLAGVDAAGTLLLGGNGFVPGSGYWNGVPSGATTACIRALALTNGGAGSYYVLAAGEDNNGGRRDMTARFHPGYDIYGSGTGGLDAGFGGSGWVNIYSGAADASASALAIDASGNILVFGQAYSPALNGNHDAIVTRLLPGGSLDSGFNGGVSLAFGATYLEGNEDYYPVGGAVDGGGEIFVPVAARKDYLTSALVPGILRIAANGSEDATADGSAYQGDAYEVEPFVGVDEARFLATAVQDDGRILAAGYRVLGGVKQGLIMRFMTGGTVDGTFGFEGLFEIAGLNGGDCAIEAIRVLPDGKILVAGPYGQDASNVGRVFVARQSAAGGTDPSFGSSGRRSFIVGSTPGTTAHLEDLDVDYATGRIYAAGWFNDGSTDNPILVQMDSDGTTNAMAGMPFGYTGVKLHAVRFIDSGSVMAVGEDASADRQAYALKTSYGDPSTVTGFDQFPDAGNDRYVTGLAKTRDGAFYACGYHSPTSNAAASVGFLMKLDASGVNPAIDPGWGSSGLCYFNYGGSSRDQILDVAAHPDGDLFISGRNHVDNAHKAYAARIDLPGGTEPSWYSAMSPAAGTYPANDNAAFESVAIGLDSAAAVGWVTGAEGVRVPSVMVLR